MSKISDLYGFGDIKYYRTLHKLRQQEMGTPAVTYEQFRRRLKANRTLKEAIYTPAEVKTKTRDYWSNRDWIRKANLIANDIRFKGERLDHVFRKVDVKDEMSYDNMFKKPTLRNRFKNLFRR